MRRTCLYILLLVFSVSCNYKRHIDASHIQLSPFFSSGMVLPAEPTTRIWGKADPGATLAVRIAEYLLIVSADHEGNWETEFPRIVFEKPFSISIEGRDTLITLNNIHTGRIVVVAGDADMTLNMGNPDACDIRDEKAAYKIRVFKPETNLTTIARKDFSGGKWMPAEEAAHDPGTCRVINFIKRSYSSEGPTIGIIDMTVPNSSLENWLPGEEDPAVTELQLQTLQKVNDSVATLQSSMFDTCRSGVESRAFRFWYNDGDWPEISLPVRFPIHAENKRVSYLRKRIYVPSQYLTSDFHLRLGYLHGNFEFVFNEQPVESRTDSTGVTYLNIPDTLMRVWTNLLAVRVTGDDPYIGLFGENFLCYNKDSSYYRSISESWKVNHFLEPDFPRFLSFDDFPAIAFNMGISPLSRLAPEALVFYTSPQMISTADADPAEASLLRERLPAGTRLILSYPAPEVADTLIFKINLKNLQANTGILRDSCLWEVNELKK